MRLLAVLLLVTGSVAKNMTDSGPSVIVVGFPKSGTSTISEYFSCMKKKVSHFICKKEECSECIYKNYKKKVAPFQECGIYDVYAQMDSSHNTHCFFPQITMLKELHSYYPDALWILNMRPFDSWIRSVNHWGDLRQRLTHCELPGFPAMKNATDAQFRRFFDGHIAHVRELVDTHPWQQILEVDIESEANNLVNIFGHRECWGHSNMGKYKH